MIGLLHFFDGFEPVQMTKTIAFACLASVAFMSVMYFFTNTFGKVGSFLMLIFMVIQLAGSVGTYPLELSGSFVPYLHDWVPFTYTVEAFRSTIAGRRKHPERSDLPDRSMAGIYRTDDFGIPDQSCKDQERQTDPGILVGEKRAGVKVGRMKIDYLLRKNYTSV